MCCLYAYTSGTLGSHRWPKLFTNPSVCHRHLRRVIINKGILVNNVRYDYDGTVTKWVIKLLTLPVPGSLRYF